MLWKTCVMFMWVSLRQPGRPDINVLKFYRTSMKTCSENVLMSCKTLPLPANWRQKHVHVASDMFVKHV